MRRGATLRRDERWSTTPARATCVAAIAFMTIVAGCRPAPPVARSPERTPEGIVFRYRAPAAHVVQLAGSWDGNTFLRGQEWSRDTRVGVMQGPDHDGVWEARLPLGPGRYEYLFLVDGTFWEADPGNPERVPDGRGGTRSLLIVP